MVRFQRRLDEEAFRLIFLRFVGPALATARQMVSDAQLAEDAVQETFLRVVRNRRRYRPSAKFAPWFYAILRNVCRDILRRESRRKEFAQPAEVLDSLPAQAEPPRDSYPLGLLATLPPGYRAVLTLRMLEGLSFREIGVALGISEEAAKKRAQRGLQKLRRSFFPRPAHEGVPCQRARIVPGHDALR